jgi:hypothetical protein
MPIVLKVAHICDEKAVARAAEESIRSNVHANSSRLD